MSVRHEHRIENLRYAEIPRLVQTFERAFEHNPSTTYTTYTPDFIEKPWHRTRERARMHLFFGIHVAERGKTILTIEHGVAGAIVWQPDELRNDRLDKVLDDLLALIFRGLAYTYTPQQLTRKGLLQRGVAARIREAVGPRVASMVRVYGLMTDPGAQGCGYGSALLDAIKADADAQGRAIILSSSNEDNTRFYERHGFKTIVQFMMGDDDATWDKEPFLNRIMIREPETLREDEVIS